MGAKAALVVLGLVLTAETAFFVYQGLRGVAFFGIAGSESSDLASAREALRAAGETPYSADQYLFLAIAALWLVLVPALVVPGGFLRKLRMAAGIAIVVAAGCLVGLVLEIVAAASGERFSNYLPPDYVGRSWVFPIGGFAVATAAYLALAFGAMRLARRLAETAAPPAEAHR